MSAPVQTAQSEAVPSGQVETTGAPAPASAPGPAATNPASKTPPNYDWEREAKEARSSYDRLANDVKPLQETLKQYNLDPLRGANALRQFDSVLRHEKLGPAVRELLMTGKVPDQIASPTPAPAEDVYVDPDVKALRDEIAELKSQLGTVARNAHTTASSQVNQLITSHENEFLSQYSLTPEEKQRFHEGFAQQYGWMVENAPDKLVNMQRPTYRRIALPVLDEILGERGILGLAERGLAQRQQGLAARATDAPLRAQTTGNEPSPPATFSANPRESDIKRVAREALEQFRRQKGIA